MKIMHVTVGLNRGGAEGTLYKLILNDSSNQHYVISLTSLGQYGPLLLDKGIPVYALNLKADFSLFSGLTKLFNLISSFSPDIVQTWMYHSDLLGGFVGKALGIPVVWNIRRTSLEFRTISLRTFFLAHLSSLLSYYIPSKIVSCSHAAVLSHCRVGYNSSIIKVIPNGFDSYEYQFDTQQITDLKKQFFSDNSDPIIGMVARYNIAKDHLTLLRATARVLKQGFNFRLILIGLDVDVHNLQLAKAIEDLAITDNVCLFGPSSNIPLIMCSLDIHILSSLSEGFPNVIAEAMFASTPCISTDVGDARRIIGDTGWLVPPECEFSMSQAIIKALTLYRDSSSWSDIKSQCRDKVCKLYDISLMTENYNRVWRTASSLQNPSF